MKMKHLAACVLLAFLLVGCKTETFTVSGTFDRNMTYIEYIEASSELVTGNDCPMPAGAVLKFWHAVDTSGDEYIATKIEDSNFFGVPVEYGCHVWKLRFGEWPHGLGMLGKAWDWANMLDEDQAAKLGMVKVGIGAAWRRVSDQLKANLPEGCACWQPK